MTGERRAAAIEAGTKVARDSLVAWVGTCTCDDAYRDRELIDPQCDYHVIEPEVSAPEIAAAVIDAALPHLVGEPVPGVVRSADGRSVIVTVITEDGPQRYSVPIGSLNLPRPGEDQP